MNKKQGSLRSTMFAMTLLPLFLLGLCISAFSSYTFTKGMHSEVENDLKHLGSSLVTTYDLLYPGDYQLVGEGMLALLKGETILNGNFEVLDLLKEQTGADFSLFYQDTRVLTTIMDENAERFVGSGAHKQISAKVLQNAKGSFFSNVIINGTKYFAYYTPLFNEDGSCVGMIGVGKSAQIVNSIVNKAVLFILLLALVITLIMAFIIINYTNGIATSIYHIKQFLSEVAKGNLTGRLDYQVTKRQDELGDVGRFTLHVQKSLRELIEQDVLTGLYNRRCGEDKLRLLDSLAKKNTFNPCIALGDIDFFKKFNDTYGHECGDMVLRECSKIFRQDMTGKGFVIRWGGEEFLFVFDQESMYKAKSSLSETLNRIRNYEFLYNDEVLHVTMTFGLSEHNFNASIFDSIKAADDKLYSGKANGRDQVAF